MLSKCVFHPNVGFILSKSTTKTIKGIGSFLVVVVAVVMVVVDGRGGEGSLL